MQGRWARIGLEEGSRHQLPTGPQVRPEGSIEIGKKIMAEVIAAYPNAGRGAAAAPAGHGPAQAHKVAEK